MKWKLWFVGRLLLMLVAVVVMGALVMLLWNAVVPALLPAARLVDYPTALGLLLLCRLLFGGFRHGGGWHGRHRWEKWQAMTPEEREQFRHRGPFGGRHRGERS